MQKRDRIITPRNALILLKEWGQHVFISDYVVLEYGALEFTIRLSAKREEYETEMSVLSFLLEKGITTNEEINELIEDIKLCDDEDLIIERITNIAKAFHAREGMQEHIKEAENMGYIINLSLETIIMRIKIVFRDDSLHPSEMAQELEKKLHASLALLNT